MTLGPQHPACVCVGAAQPEFTGRAEAGEAGCEAHCVSGVVGCRVDADGSQTERTAVVRVLLWSQRLTLPWSDLLIPPAPGLHTGLSWHTGNGPLLPVWLFLVHGLHSLLRELSLCVTCALKTVPGFQSFPSSLPPFCPGVLVLQNR